MPLCARSSPFRTFVAWLVVLLADGCSTAAAELWPVEEAEPISVVDIRLIASGGTDSERAALDSTLEMIAMAVASAPGSRVRVIEPTCTPTQVYDETSGVLPARPRARPRHVERETARMVDRMASALASPIRSRGLCLAEAISVAASADGVEDADDIHIIIASSLIEASRFARLARGRLPTARVLLRRAAAQRLFSPGTLSGLLVHIAGSRQQSGVSFARTEAVLELWLALLDRAGASDVRVTTGPAVLDDGISPDVNEEEEE